jgi:raffinose/stachyose/melibiose transport system permease protein
MTTPIAPASAATGALVDTAEHGQADHLAGTPTRRGKPRTDPIYYWFLIPTLALFTLAITVPAIIGILYSFTNFIGFGDWQWIGLVNYIAVFSDPAILSSYLFTFGFAIVTVLLVNVIAFLLAIGLTSRIKLKTSLRAVFVIPMVISGIVIAYVFNFLFSNSLPAFGAAVGSPSRTRTWRGSPSSS